MYAYGMDEEIRIHTHIKELIERLNVELHRNCPRLSFTYTRRWDKSIKISIVHITDRTVDASYIHLDPPKEDELVLEFSRTSGRFEQRKLNKCLRYLAAMIASLRQCYLVSHAINWISLYTMSSIFEDCEIKRPTGKFEHVGALNKDQCKDLIAESPDKSVTSRVDTRDYDKFERKLFEAIPTINYTDLGGTRKRRKRRSNRHRE